MRGDGDLDLNRLALDSGDPLAKPALQAPAMSTVQRLTTAFGAVLLSVESMRIRLLGEAGHTAVHVPPSAKLNCATIGLAGAEPLTVATLAVMTG